MIFYHLENMPLFFFFQKKILISPCCTKMISLPILAYCLWRRNGAQIFHVSHWVTGHLATRKFCHQRTCHHYAHVLRTRNGWYWQCLGLFCGGEFVGGETRWWRSGQLPSTAVPVASWPSRTGPYYEQCISRGLTLTGNPNGFQPKAITQRVNSGRRRVYREFNRTY